MNWDEITKILSSGDSGIIIKCGFVKVRPSHQIGRAVMNCHHEELSLFEPINTRIYDWVGKIISHMKDIQPDSNRWIRL